MRLSTEYRPPLSSECLKRVGGVGVGLLEKKIRYVIQIQMSGSGSSWQCNRLFHIPRITYPSNS